MARTPDWTNRSPTEYCSKGECIKRNLRPSVNFVLLHLRSFLLRHWRLCVAGIYSLLALTMFLGRVPGLHGDEAWVGLRALEILNGARPLLGMNSYTGPLHQYLVAISLSLFGPSVSALRSITVLGSLASLFLYDHLVGKLFDRPTARLATPILVTTPFFVSYGRIATENFALNPVLTLISLAAFIEAGGKSGGRKVAWALVAGLASGFGVWNHGIFAPVPLLITLFAIVHFRGRGLRAMLLAYAGGIVVALTPRLAAESSGESPSVYDQLAHALQGYTERAAGHPNLFAAILDGDVLYQRTAGEVIWAAPPLLSVLLGTSLAAMLWHIASSGPHRLQYASVLVAFALSFLATMAIAPGDSDRYFLLPLYFAPLFIAILLSRMVPWHRAPSWVRTSSLALLFLLMIGRTWLNYFYSCLRSGGKESIFQLGTTQETSNHFVRSDGVIDVLRRNDVAHVCAEYFIGMPLRFYVAALEIPNLSVELPDLTRVGNRSSCTLVVYRDGLRRIGENWMPDASIVWEDAHFRILTSGAHSRRLGNPPP